MWCSVVTLHDSSVSDGQSSPCWKGNVLLRPQWVASLKSCPWVAALRGAEKVLFRAFLCHFQTLSVPGAPGAGQLSHSWAWFSFPCRWLREWLLRGPRAVAMAGARATRSACRGEQGPLVSPRTQAEKQFWKERTAFLLIFSPEGIPVRKEWGFSILGRGLSTVTVFYALCDSD